MQCKSSGVVVEQYCAGSVIGGRQAGLGLI